MTDESNDPQSCDLRARSEAFTAAWRKAAAQGFRIYRSILPWFGPAMGDAGWPADTPEVSKAWKRAHAEWSELTGLEPLCNEDAWRAAAAKAGYLATDWNELEWRELGGAVRAWAVAETTEARRTTKQSPPKKGTGGRTPSKKVANRNKRVLADFEKGVSVNDIAEKYSISANLASKIKSRANATERES